MESILKLIPRVVMLSIFVCLTGFSCQPSLINWELNNEMEKLLGEIKIENIKEKNEATIEKQIDAKKLFDNTFLKPKPIEKILDIEDNEDEIKTQIETRNRIVREKSELINKLISNHLNRVIQIRDELSRRRSLAKSDYRGTVPPGLHDEPK
ncbi:uncharacterized protein LOC101237891 [Hydra vulgaris]|uniref:uncharacterized protein LOC101237891 n=1 Tax=Hydra vulgaris TaxID=6087 RepID=UPI001F5E7AA6|nr:uncharacterized protein LOC101237891 [Hydra vulgaris]